MNTTIYRWTTHYPGATLVFLVLSHSLLKGMGKADQDGDGTWSFRYILGTNFKGISIPYKVGDYLYLAKDWAMHDGEYLLRQEPDCDVSEHEDDWIDWQPALTMPIEAAQGLLLVTNVQIKNKDSLTPEDYIAMGLLSEGWSDDLELAQAMYKIRCDYDDWLILLSVEPVDFSLAEDPLKNPPVPLRKPILYTREMFEKRE